MITNLTDLTDEQREARARLMFARTAICEACEQRTFIWSGWTWARCWAWGLGADSRPTFALSGEFAGMDDKGQYLGVMDGPESNCPLGKWDGVVAPPPATVEQMRLELEEHAVRFLKRFGPILKRLPNKRADFIAALDEMVNLQSAPGEKSINLSVEMRDALVAALEKAEATSA